MLNQQVAYRSSKNVRILCAAGEDAVVEQARENTFAGLRPAAIGQSDFFRQQQTRVSTSEGDVDVPILYAEASQVLALFLVDGDRAQAAIGARGLRAVGMALGQALAAVAFYEYRRTTIGVYNEVAVAIAAVPANMKTPRLPMISLFRKPENNVVGFHILDLPVTTDAACVAGKDIWGFPKFVTRIGFTLQDRLFKGTVLKPGSSETLIQLFGHIGLGVPGPLLDLVLYSNQNGQLLRTFVNTRGGAMIALPGSVQLDVARGDHPMAQNLNALDLAGKKPLLVVHTDKLQFSLPAGSVLS